MCGIVGILGKGPVAEQLVDALKRLEYRGYDSAGVATVENGHLGRRRAEGKLRNLEERLKREPLLGDTGIGHTRWATHGKPVEANAHPHMTELVSVVHNGIIENFRELKEELIRDGAAFTSDTDTEVIAHLITRELKAGNDPVRATYNALKRLKGAFALAMIFRGYNDLMIVARQGSPLAIGYGDGEMFVGSDAIALAPFTDAIVYLEDGDWAVLTRKGVAIRDRNGKAVERAVTRSLASALLVDKGNHRHFMAKEIYEQPEVVGHTLAAYVDLGSNRVDMPALPVDFANITRLSLSACGTAFYACLVAKYWFERWARLPVDVDIASEFRYRETALDPGGAALFVSQSGETADTLATLRYCRAQAQHILSVVNVREVLDRAGVRCGVADACRSRDRRRLDQGIHLSAHGARLSRDCRRQGAWGYWPRARGRAGSGARRGAAPYGDGAARRAALRGARPSPVQGARRALSRTRVELSHRLEGALKLKEISYIHAEGYAAGELKHGPIALIDENMPVIVIAPRDDLYDKTVSNMQEVAARGGQIVLVSDADAASTGCAIATHLAVPPVHRFVAPLVYAVPVQLIAYHTAVFMGTDVDQPRNLAKSVTVE